MKRKHNIYFNDYMTLQAICIVVHVKYELNSLLEKVRRQQTCI